MEEYYLVKRQLILNMTTFSNISFAFQTVGLALTVLTLMLLLFTCVLHHEWRQAFKNQLLVQLMTSRFVYVLTRYVCETSLLFDFYEIDNSWINLLVHIYTELTVLSWMFVFSKNMYDDLVKVITIKTSHRLLKVTLACWLLPLPLSVATCVFLSKESLRELYLFLSYTMLLKWPVLVANGYTITRIIKSLRRDSREKQSNRKITIVMLYLLFVFCIQHFFNDGHKLLFIILINGQKICIPTMLIKTFYIVSMYQCSGAIMFWLFCNKNTRQFWTKIICETLNG